MLKRKIAFITSLLLMFSILPASSFADAKVSVISGITTVSTTDTNKEVKISIDMGKHQDLKQGKVIVELDNTQLAKTANPATAVIYQGSSNFSAPEDIKVLSTSGNALTGGETMFNIEIGKDFKGDGQELNILLTLRLDFSQADNGAVNISLKDIGKDGVLTGVGDFNSASVAKKSDKAPDEPQVRILNENAKIGPAGGKLSRVTIYNLAKLSGKAEDNLVTFKLPEGLMFEKNSKIEADGVTPKVSYTVDGREMIVRGLKNTTAYLTVEPSVVLSAKSTLSDGAIKSTIEFTVDKKPTYSEEFQVGSLVQFGFSVSAVQSGKTLIPTLKKGVKENITVTVDAVEGTLGKGDVINFNIDSAEIVFGSIKVSEPAGLILSTSKSAGKNMLVSGEEIYIENDFAVRSNKDNITKIVLTMDIVEGNNSKEKAVMEVSSKKVEAKKVDIANVNKSVKLDLVPKTLERGKIVDLPDIVINETVAGTWQPADKIYLELFYPNSNKDKGEYIFFETDKNIKVESSNTDVMFVNYGDQRNILVVTVKNKSTGSPGVIKLSNLKGYLTEKAPATNVDLRTSINNALVGEDVYFKVNETATVGQTKFVIGSKNYLANGENKTLNTAPYVKAGRTMLPVRAVGDSLGLTASWNPATKTATFTGESKIATVKIGDSTMTVNGTAYPLSVPAEIKDGSTMIELKSLANAFTVNIGWDGATKTVTVN